MDDQMQFRDAELALVDSIKSVLEVLMSADIVAPDVLGRLFQDQRDHYLAEKMPLAAAVSEMLRTFVLDPSRKAFRDRLHKALREPPQGTA